MSKTTSVAKDTKGHSALHFAASGKVCDLLFAGGFTEINALDKQNRSALHTARNASVAKAILEHPNFNQLNVTWKFSQLWEF